MQAVIVSGAKQCPVGAHGMRPNEGGGRPPLQDGNCNPGNAGFHTRSRSNSEQCVRSGTDLSKLGSVAPRCVTEWIQLASISN